MTRDFCKLISFLIVILIISSSRLSESRILSPRGSTNSVAKGIEFLIDGLYIEGIKTGGPSAGGEGHGFKNAETLREGEAGGPSDGGAGHKFTKVEILGGRKNGGPSAGGVGHSTNRKNGGPSAGGVGHSTKNSKVFRTSHPQSGPRTGEGH